VPRPEEGHHRRASSRSLLVGLPATLFAVAGGTLLADWVWLRKTFWAAVINFGREAITLIAAYGAYAGILSVSGVRYPGLQVDTIPALFFFALAYFIVGRLLFYISLLVRDKLEQNEQLLIIRYEVIAYFGTIGAVTTVVSAVLAWPPVTWLFVAAALGALGQLLKQMLEEAISAEELNKIHAIESVITSNISLHDSFQRIERLAHRLVDWGDLRIYRRADAGMHLAYRSAIGRPERTEPTPDVAALRMVVVETATACDTSRSDAAALPIVASWRVIRSSVSTIGRRRSLMWIAVANWLANVAIVTMSLRRYACRL